MYKRDGKCLPCQCNWPVGASVEDCDATTGQCRCRGDSIGRRCDQCADPRAQINQTTAQCQGNERIYILKCNFYASVIPGKCPEQIDWKVTWPSTFYGMAAVRSCPEGVGLAVRECGEAGIWKRPSLINCSSEGFARISSTVSVGYRTAVSSDSSLPIQVVAADGSGRRQGRKPRRRPTRRTRTAQRNGARRSPLRSRRPHRLPRCVGHPASRAS